MNGRTCQQFPLPVRAMFTAACSRVPFVCHTGCIAGTYQTHTVNKTIMSTIADFEYNSPFPSETHEECNAN